MKPTENIKKLIESTKVTTNPERDNAVLNELLKELDQSEKIHSCQEQLNVWRIKSKIMKFAVGAVMTTCFITMLVLFATKHDRKEPIAKSYHSSSNLQEVSRYKLQRAFDVDGMEGVERQCEKAYDEIWPEIDVSRAW